MFGLWTGSRVAPAHHACRGLAVSVQPTTVCRSISAGTAPPAQTQDHVAAPPRRLHRIEIETDKCDGESTRAETESRHGRSHPRPRDGAVRAVPSWVAVPYRTRAWRDQSRGPRGDSRDVPPRGGAGAPQARG